MVDIRLDAQWIDYAIIALYFVFVLGVGWYAKRGVSNSIEFFLSGRSLPAWVTGLAFISANLGAVEIMGMSATGAQYGMPTMHYFWVGAIPAMLFLGVVMMPFYYGSKVRSVPEFMRMRFGTGAHLVNSISFAVAQLLIAGVNLSLLAIIVNRLLGWPMWVGLVLAAAFVLFYITVGGLSAAIYNEVLQFFVIVAALLPLTLIGLHRVGGWNGMKERIAGDGMLGEEQLHSWPGQALSGFDSPILSVVGIVFGLGFVLSFGYWTTNFVEVQRAMASKSITAARMTPIIGAFPKMFIPFIVIIPGMLAAVLVGELTEFKQLDVAGDAAGAAATGVTYNDALLLLMRDVLPNGLLGVAIAGLLAAFMAGMAANISAFNTVVTYDLYEQYVKKDAPDAHYIKGGALRDARRLHHRDLHRADRRQLLEPDGLPAGPLRVLQRAAVRDIHPGHVLEADVPDRRLGRSGRRHALRRGPVGRLDVLQHLRAAGPGSRLRLRGHRLRGRHHRLRGGHAVHRPEAGARAEGPRLLRDPEGRSGRCRREEPPVLAPPRPDGGHRPRPRRHPEHRLRLSADGGEHS